MIPALYHLALPQARAYPATRPSTAPVQALQFTDTSQRLVLVLLPIVDVLGSTSQVHSRTIDRRAHHEPWTGIFE